MIHAMFFSEVPQFCDSNKEKQNRELLSELFQFISKHSGWVTVKATVTRKIFEENVE